MILRKRIAFTLAEILITLTIIGVVASLTIPSLINNISDQQYRVAWRKSFADISQVTARIIADNGGTIIGLCSNADNNCLRNKFSVYLNYIKSCDQGVAWGNCWHNGSFMMLNGSTCTTANSASLILSNGSFMRFTINRGDCSLTSGTSITNKCGYIAIDINGFKGPNIMGKDLFWVTLLSNSIKPYGYQGDGIEQGGYTCIEGNTDSLNTGEACSALYLYQ